MCMHTCMHIIYNTYVILSWAKSGYHQWIWSINIYKPYIMWIVHRWPSKIVGKWRLLRVRYAIGVLCLMAEMPRRIYPILSMLKQHGILRADYLFYLCILYTSVYLCILCLFLEIWRGSSRSVDISWLGELPNQLPQPCQWRTYLGGANRPWWSHFPMAGSFECQPTWYPAKKNTTG